MTGYVVFWSDPLVSFHPCVINEIVSFASKHAIVNGRNAVSSTGDCNRFFTLLRISFYSTQCIQESRS